ncbi:U-box domain-containing protein 16-like [Canna indica]|uniref:RING-type E3 ubiquitin transferase n=1 Tax=Canna indica TaxID=4628 RepID=A0AAQ3JUQ8_9LILI|nr:U-box domain-containing protein 16-like [Canna indica]
MATSPFLLPSSSPPPPPDPSSDADLLRHLLFLSRDVSSSAQHQQQASSSSSLRVNPNFSSVPRNVKQLALFFEELLLVFQDDEDGGFALPRSASLCCREILLVLHRLKGLFHDRAARSRAFTLFRAEAIAAELHEQVVDLATFLDLLPLAELRISDDVRDLVRLLRRQLRRSSPAVDSAALALRRDILELIAGVEGGSVPDRGALQGFFRRFGLNDAWSCCHEIERLENDIADSGADDRWAPVMVALASILRYARCVLFGASTPKSDSSAGGSKSPFSAAEDIAVPADFRCPVSLDLMRDPVVVATGQTYDRESIVRWIGSGHATCPKSGQALSNLELVPNRALKNLIACWCRDNNLPFDEGDASSNTSDKQTDADNVIAVAETNKAALEAARMTASFLVDELAAAASTEAAHRVVHELRLLAKHGADNRAFVAEAGAIPLILPLLRSAEAGLQVNAVTALLNLSILEANKRRIMHADGAIDGLVHVLADGASWRAKENAAATVLSLSSVHSYRRRLARHRRLVEDLVQMSREGPTSAKKDAMAAILSLAGDRENTTRLVEAGVVAAALEVAAEPEVAEEAAAVLAAVARRGGAEAVAEAEGSVARLVGVLRRGSDWARESAAAALVAVCRRSAAGVVAELAAVPGIEWVIWELMGAGTERARRKAAALGRICRRWAAAVEAERTTRFSAMSVTASSTTVA